MQNAHRIVYAIPFNLMKCPHSAIDKFILLIVGPSIWNITAVDAISLQIDIPVVVCVRERFAEH
jgi:hypothetical protein